MILFAAAVVIESEATIAGSLQIVTADAETAGALSIDRRDGTAGLLQDEHSSGAGTEEDQVIQLARPVVERKALGHRSRLQPPRRCNGRQLHSLAIQPYPRGLQRLGCISLNAEPGLRCDQLHEPRLVIYQKPV